MQVRKLFFIGIGVIAVIFFVWMLNRFILSPRAAQNNISVTAAPKSGTVASGGTGEVEFILTPDKPENKIAGADVQFTAQNATITELSLCSTTQGDTSLFTELISKVTGSTARKSCVSLKKDAELPATVVVKVKFACSGSSPATIGVDTQSSQIVGNVAEVQYGFGNVDTAQFTCGEGTPTGPGASISFEPNNCTMEVGGNCSYKLKVTGNQATDKISGYHAVITFDPVLVQAQKVETASPSGLLQLLSTPGPALTGTPSTRGTPPPVNAPTGGPTGGAAGRACSTDNDCVQLAIQKGFCQAGQACPIQCDASGQCQVTSANPTGGPQPTQPTVPTGGPLPSFAPPGGPGGPIAGCFELQNKIDNEKGQIQLTYVCIKSQQELPTSMTANLTFTGKSDGEGKLIIDSSEVVGPTTGNSYPVITNNASYRVGKGGSGVAVELILRFQGVTKKPKAKDMVKVRVGASDGRSEPTYVVTELKVGDDGLWRGTAVLPVSTGSNYKILIKGEKHMQRKVCVAKPTEDFPGAYRCDKGRVALSSKTTLDASGIVLLVGDLEPQDGISNAHDQSLVRNMLGRSDDECRRLADVNYDGVCNAIDHSLMIAALSVRYDDPVE